jgi:thymidylate synthase
MAELIKGQTANDLWCCALNLLVAEGMPAPSRNGRTKEILHVMLELKNPQEKWVYKRFPPISVAFALAELMWIVNGENDVKTIDFWNLRYKKTAADAGSEIYHGAYGSRLRTQHGIDQIERAYQALLANPNNRQTVMLLWDAKTDMPKWDGTPQSRDIPCNICSMLKVRDGYLEWTQIMRSNDIVLGLPYNIVQFTSLQEIMAGWLGLKVGSYNHFSDSLHIYDKYDFRSKVGFSADIEEITNTDSLSIPKPEFDKIAKDIMARMRQMSDMKKASNVSEKKEQETALRSLSTLGSMFKAYNNVLFIIGAKASLRFKQKKLARELVEKCSNPIYKRLMELKEIELQKLFFRCKSN